MLALDPAALVAAEAAPDATAGLRERLAEVARALDSGFNAASTGLAEAIAAIDEIVAALQAVAGAFENGAAAAAVADLTRAAQALAEVPGEVARRDGEIGAIRDATRSLRRNLADVHKCLRVLQIYGMNVKIAAFGAGDFVDFADRMSEKLGTGLDEAKGLEETLRALEASVGEVEQVDARLAVECKRIIPAVPEALARDAAALSAHQARLVELASATAETARTIQRELAAALGAIQVGDRARQRLEHIVNAATLLEGALAGRAGMDAVRGHVRRLLGDLTAAAAFEFDSELSALLGALRGLQQAARQLIELRSDDDADDAEFLRRLEQGVATAGAMIAQLDRAESQALRTLDIIQHTVGEVSSRAAAVRDLRFEVRLMAINIALRCRRVEAIGRPVTVIANEIRSHSDQLDGVIDQLALDEMGLATTAGLMRERKPDGASSTSAALAQSLATIRDGAGQTELALDTVRAHSGGVNDLLRKAIERLDECLELAPAMATCGAELGDAGGLGAVAEDAELRALLDAIAATYSMADERRIHNGHLLPGMPPLATETAQADADDDDSLLDDALF